MIYLVVEQQWFFNDEWWSVYMDGGGAARQQFETEELAHLAATALNREALRAGRWPPPTGTESAGVENNRRLCGILGIDDPDQLTNEFLVTAFKELPDQDLNRILEMMDNRYFEVVALDEAEPSTDLSGEWYLLVECHHVGDGYEDFERTLSVIPTREEAEARAMAFNLEALTQKDGEKARLPEILPHSSEEDFSQMRKALLLPENADLSDVRFPADGTLEMVRNLATQFSFTYQDVRPCPGMEEMNK